MAGGGGDMLSGWRGTNAGSMYAPTTHNLTDEPVLGKAYDNRVVRRLLTYVVPYKRDALISVVAMLVYTAANVGLPLVIMFGMNWGINSGEVWRLHVVGLAFLGVTGLHFAANYVQLVFMARVGQSLLYSVRTALFHHLQRLSPAFFHRTSPGHVPGLVVVDPEVRVASPAGVRLPPCHLSVRVVRPHVHATVEARGLLASHELPLGTIVEDRVRAAIAMNVALAPYQTTALVDGTEAVGIGLQGRGTRHAGLGRGPAD